MIIIGYQGIGKTSLAKKDPKFIDLESTNTWFKDHGKLKRWSNWGEIYTNFAKDLSKNYNHHVFVSSHLVVRNALQSVKDDVMVCYPAIELKDKWIEKLEERYNSSKLDKDYRALMNAKDRYVDNVTEIMDSGFRRCPITTMDYNLKELLENEIEKAKLDYIASAFKNN